MGKDLRWPVVFRESTVHVVMAKPFSAMKHRAVLRHGTQVHEFDNRSWTDGKGTRTRGWLSAGRRSTVYHLFVIAGQGTVMVVSIKLPISTTCWRQSSAEA
jgi:hypothetical protein